MVDNGACVTTKLRQNLKVTTFLSAFLSMTMMYSIYNHRIHSQHYSPYSFYKFKSELPSRVSDSSFSLLHNNIRSLKRNLENFQVHLLDELNFEFSIIGVSETKIISGKEMDFNPSIPGYVFEYVPSPLEVLACILSNGPAKKQAEKQ